MSVHRIWSHKIELTAHACSASQARAFVTRHLMNHDIADMVNDVQLVVSELATNATLHAQTPFTVVLEASNDVVFLEVRDGSQVGPHLIVARTLETSGRGVAIVQALSRCWGVTAGASGGKSVWVEFHIPDASTPQR